MNDIEINNNVKIGELYDGKTWVHGEHPLQMENIQITLFLVTINGHQLKYALDSINKLNTNISILVNVIMNISPTNKAYNMMRIRCKTKYFIQFDEDMEIFQNGIEIMVNTLESGKSRDKKKFLYCFRLIDEYLGVSNPPTIYGMKLYNQQIMSQYPTSHNGEITVSSVDRAWHEPILRDCYIIDQTSITIGTHARKRKAFDLLLRYSKLTSSMMDSNVKNNSGDICKFIRPLNKIINLDRIYAGIVSHFILLGYDVNIHNKNNTIISNIFSKHYIRNSSLHLYNISKPFNLLPKYEARDIDIEAFFDLFSIRIDNFDDIYCLIGIINKLFENYEYSSDKYPYDIDKYFLRVFNISVKNSNNEKIKSALNDYDNIKYVDENYDIGDIDDDVINIEKFVFGCNRKKKLEMFRISDNDKKIKYDNNECVWIVCSEYEKYLG